MSLRKFYHSMRKNTDKDTLYGMFSNKNARNKVSGVHDSIATRSALKSRMDAKTEQGKVGITWRSTDCDGAYGEYADIYPANLYSIWQKIEDFYSGLEGPGSFSFLTPFKAQQFKSVSRDLALEAFEDGHTHLIYIPN